VEWISEQKPELVSAPPSWMVGSHRALDFVPNVVVENKSSNKHIIAVNTDTAIRARKKAIDPRGHPKCNFMIHSK
jgi:hypothetical protein